MGFYRKIPSFDLGELNIENLFITDFLPMASGTYVKVYLMGLMFSKAENTTYRFDNSVLANTLKLPLEDIHEAWKYWEEKKLVKRHHHDDTTTYDVEFLSVRELYIQDNFISKSATPSQRPSKTIENRTFKRENEEFKALCSKIEQITATPLSNADYRKLSDFYTHYYKDADIIARAFEFNYRERNIRNIKAVDSLLKSWISQGLSSLESINELLAASEARSKVYREILKLLGMSFRMANQAEKEAIDRWLDEYGFTPDTLYELLKQFSKSTMNINFNYIEARLKDLHSKNILTIEAYTAQEVKVPEKRGTAPKSKGKPQYTIEKERTYSEDELEELLLNRRK